MAKHHPLSDIITDLKRDFEGFKKDASRSKVTPLGKENITAEEARKRIKSMSPEAQAQLAQQIGVGKFMDILRGINA